MANIMRLGGGGKKAEGEIPITANGIYDVAEYASANVNVQSAPELLWTNASPTSVFAAQTVNVPSGYDGYLIELTSSTDSIGTASDNRGIGLVAKNMTFPQRIHSNLYGYMGTWREVNGVSDSSVVFGMGCQNGTNNNSRGIPLRIWGVKFTL